MTITPQPQSSDRPVQHVAVDGGRLAVHDLSGEGAREAAPAGPVVVAAHGITANALSWVPVAGEVTRRHPDIRFLAVDVRGRAKSRQVGPPFGIGVDAQDILAVADTAGRPVILLGHSMGAFVAATAAAAYPGAVCGLVLVDGGLAVPVPEAADIDAALLALIGPSMQRLDMRFDSPEDYLRFWQPHPSMGPLLAGEHGAAVRDYLLHDLVPSPDQPGRYASSCRREAIRADGADFLTDAEVLSAVSRAAAAGVPIELLWAERGLLDEPQGVYDQERLAALRVPEQVRLTRVADSNHFSIMLSTPGVTAVADALDRIL